MFGACVERWVDKVSYFLKALFSRAYWKYMLFSRAGVESTFAFAGALYTAAAILDFFGVYPRYRYASWSFIAFLLLSVIVSIVARRPTRLVSIRFPKNGSSIKVMIGDLFDASGAVVISTNSQFESDVAGGKIAPDSLQGQFTTRYFTGNQKELLDRIAKGLEYVDSGPPFPMGTTVPIRTHGKVFYLTVMADLNEQGNASTTEENVKRALDGLWTHVREAGELQELAVPVIGTGRGRLQLSRKRMIGVIAESFVRASMFGKITERLVIVVRPKDAMRDEISLHDVRDYLNQVLGA